MKLKKFLLLLVLLFPVLLCSCYDASDVEETAYLISLGIDKNGDDFSYTFQLAAPLKSSGGDSGGGAGGSEKSEDEGSEKKKNKIFDSKNPTVNNIVIAAPDFYTAKNMLSNYLSKVLNMSHLKMIVCSKAVAEDSFKEHSELFSREREIRPGTFLCVSEKKAEAFLKAVNPELEGNTAKYYELVNSNKTLIFAPVKRLGDFSNDSETLDKSAVLPLAKLSDAESSDELTVSKTENNRIIKSSVSRISGAKPELWGMAVLKNGSLIGTMDGSMAQIYNILSGHTKQFVFSVQSPYEKEKILSFKCRVEHMPDFSVQNINADSTQPEISVELNVFAEYMGTDIPKGYKSYKELNNTARQALKAEIIAFLNETAEKYSADVLKIGKVSKKDFLTYKSFDEFNWAEKYKNAEFLVNVFLTDNAVSLF